jgi:hypothetical protein
MRWDDGEELRVWPARAADGHCIPCGSSHGVYCVKGGTFLYRICTRCLRKVNGVVFGSRAASREDASHG